MPLTLIHHNNLTPASREVVDLMFQGITSDKALAAVLGLTKWGVRARIERAMWQLDLPYGTSRAQAMALALQRGLVEVQQLAHAVGRCAAALVLAVLTLHGTVVDGHDIARLARARTGQHIKTARRDAAALNPLEIA